MGVLVDGRRRVEGFHEVFVGAVGVNGDVVAVWPAFLGGLGGGGLGGEEANGRGLADEVAA